MKHPKSFLLRGSISCCDWKDAKSSGAGNPPLHLPTEASRLHLPTFPFPLMPEWTLKTLDLELLSHGEPDNIFFSDKDWTREGDSEVGRQLYLEWKLKWRRKRKAKGVEHVVKERRLRHKGIWGRANEIKQEVRLLFSKETRDPVKEKIVVMST